MTKMHYTWCFSFVGKAVSGLPYFVVVFFFSLVFRDDVAIWCYWSSQIFQCLHLSQGCSVYFNTSFMWVFLSSFNHFSCCFLAVYGESFLFLVIAISVGYFLHTVSPAYRRLFTLVSSRNSWFVCFLFLPNDFHWTHKRDENHFCNITHLFFFENIHLQYGGT